MARPRGWALAWLGWLAFLLLDFIAAAKERSGPRVVTLSRHIWAWFPMGWKRSVLAAFLAAVGAHLVLEASAWWLLTAVPVVAVIVQAVWFRDEDAMTREEWDEEWAACFGRLRAQGRELLEAQRLARDITTARYGARPAGLPIWLRLAQGVLARKLSGLQSVEVSPMMQRWVVAITYGIGAASPIIAEAFRDGSITGQEWAGIATAFGVAFWGTFKSNTTIVSPNRTEWTPEQRKVETAKMDAGVLVTEAKVVAADKVDAAKVVADAKAAR